MGQHCECFKIFVCMKYKHCVLLHERAFHRCRARSSTSNATAAAQNLQPSQVHRKCRLSIEEMNIAEKHDRNVKKIVKSSCVYVADPFEGVIPLDADPFQGVIPEVAEPYQ